MNIYLDVDGVILTKEGKPSKHVNELLNYVTNNHEVYWLTSHCKGDATYTVNYIARDFEPETVKYFEKIKATDWGSSKTEGIDFSKEFFWLDDYLFDNELEELSNNNALTSHIKIDLKNNPDDLKHFLEMLMEKDRKNIS